jgi:hypothetical protein
LRNLRSFCVKRMFLVLPIVCAITIASVPSLLGQGVEIPKAPAAERHDAPKAAGDKPTPTPTPTAAEALYDYLQKNQLKVVKDRVGSRLIWTDRVMIELTDSPLPEPLATLLAAAPPNEGRFAAWVHDAFESQLGTWHAGKRNLHPKKSGTEELVSVRGEGRCFVNPVYLAYVLSRYPEAGILIKGPTDPALFTENGQLRAVVSPWTKLPDGTPLQ